jgi:hypothetical protein
LFSMLFLIKAAGTTFILWSTKKQRKRRIRTTFLIWSTVKRRIRNDIFTLFKYGAPKNKENEGSERHF